MKFKKILIDTLKLLLRNKRQSILTSLAIAVATFVVLVILSSSSYTTSTLGDDLNIEDSIGKDVRLSASSYGLYAETYFNKTKQYLSFRTLDDLNKNGLNVPSLLKGKSIKNLNNGIAISDKALMLLTRKGNIENFLGKTINISGKDYTIQSIFYGSAVNERLPSLIVTEDTKRLLLGYKEYFDELVISTNKIENINKALSILDIHGTYHREGTYSYIDNKRVYEETKAQANTILNFIAFLSSI